VISIGLKVVGLALGRTRERCGIMVRGMGGAGAGGGPVNGGVQLGGDLSMTAESPSDRQQEWALIVRRSFGIPDLVSNKDAREALIGSLQEQLQENGWQSLTRGTAEPIVDALMSLAESGDPDDRLLRPRATANRLIDKGLSVIDPEHLVFDMMFEYPPEVVTAVEQMLVRVSQHARGHPFGD
jgi:hypothetical protein